MLQKQTMVLEYNKNQCTEGNHTKDSFHHSKARTLPHFYDMQEMVQQYHHLGNVNACVLFESTNLIAFRFAFLV